MLRPPFARTTAFVVLAMAAATGTGLAIGGGPPRAAAAPAIRASPLPRTLPRPAPVPTPAPGGYVVRRVMTLPGPFTYGDAYWDDAGAPATGAVVVTVDLAAQSLSVFRAGYEIGTAVILYGADAKPTPLGRFRVTQKDADHVSNLYDAPMPFMLRLTDDGVSIHGADVRRDRATHGCVGVPTWFARKLFAVVTRGDLVIVTRGERLDRGDTVQAAAAR